jgi:hypothetical protein
MQSAYTQKKAERNLCCAPNNPSITIWNTHLHCSSLVEILWSISKEIPIFFLVQTWRPLKPGSHLFSLVMGTWILSCRKLLQCNWSPNLIQENENWDILELDWVGGECYLWRHMVSVFKMKIVTHSTDCHDDKYQDFSDVSVVLKMTLLGGVLLQCSKQRHE